MKYDCLLYTFYTYCIHSIESYRHQKIIEKQQENKIHKYKGRRNGVFSIYLFSFFNIELDFGKYVHLIQDISYILSFLTKGIGE